LRGQDLDLRPLGYEFKNSHFVFFIFLVNHSKSALYKPLADLEFFSFYKSLLYFSYFLGFILLFGGVLAELIAAKSIKRNVP
jgi:hypothetical protein